MEGLRNPWRMKQYLIIGWVLVFVLKLLGVAGSYAPGPWNSAHATFYSNANGGACGYGNSNDYGTSTTAVSTTLFGNGNACGQCFQLKCVDSKWCYPFSPTVTVTATNLCPPNWYVPSNAGGWCNPPQSHFDLSEAAFTRFAIWKAGIVPVKFRRVACSRKGGVRFNFQGNSNWLLVYVSNVGGSGDVGSMWVKGSRTGWIKMSRNWGAAFQAFSALGGQTLSFKLQSGSTSQTIIANNVASGYWSSGQTYQANVNFK